MDSRIVLPRSALLAHAASPIPDDLPAPHSTSPTAHSLEALVKVMEVEHQTPAEQFKAIVNEKPISAADWEEVLQLDSLGALTQRSPAFDALNPHDIRSHACLTLTKQPGPVYVANAHATAAVFHVQLLPHPLMPAQALKTWKIGPLKVQLLPDGDDDMRSGSKKRGRPTKQSQSPPPRQTSAKRKAHNAAANFHREYTFDKLDIQIADMSFPASGCRPVRLEFSCSIMDPLSREATFLVYSNPFMIISNCNQWKDGLAVCLRNFVFPDGTTQAPFNRFFNFLHLAYLDSKGFPEPRFLDPAEIRLWLRDSLDVAQQQSRGAERDRLLLESHNVVTEDLFENWFDMAGPVLYDLHTSNVGKLFQKLWATGFVGIGTTRTTNDTLDSTPGHYRLNINTQLLDDRPQESYLVLQAPNQFYPLLALERDHLAYFFEHSRNSRDCTHLISATTVGKALSIQTIFTPRTAPPPPQPSPQPAPSHPSHAYGYTTHAKSSPGHPTTYSTANRPRRHVKEEH